MTRNGTLLTVSILSLPILIPALFCGCASSPTYDLVIDTPEMSVLDDDNAYTAFRFNSEDGAGKTSRALILIDEKDSDSPDVYTENLASVGKMTLPEMTRSYEPGETITWNAIELNGKVRGYIIFNSNLNVRSWFNKEIGMLTFTISSDQADEPAGKIKWIM